MRVLTTTDWAHAGSRRPLRLAVDGAGAYLATLVVAAGFLSVAQPGTLALLAVLAAATGVGLGVAFAGRVPLMWLPPSMFLAAVVVGPLAVGRAPTPTALVEATRAVVTSWKDLLTTAPPLDGDAEALYAVFLTILLSGLAVTLAATRFGRPLVAYGCALVGLGVAVWLSSVEVVHPAVVGAALLAVVLSWSAVRARLGLSTGAGPDDVAVTRRVRPLRAVLALVMVAAAAAIGISVAPMGSDPQARALLRDRVEPPLDVRQYVSPLVGFRNFRGDLRSASLFTVDHAPAGGRLRLAALEAYDGVVFGASGGRTGDSGVFEKLSRARTRDGAWSDLPTGPEERIAVTVGDLTGVWTPGLPVLDDVDGTGGEDATSPLQVSELYANPASGTLVSTGGLRPGTGYTVSGRVGATPSDDEADEAAVADVVLPPAENVPDIVATVAEEVAGAESSPVARARALEAHLRSTGFYSSGQRGEVRSRAGHNADRIEILLDSEQMVGDEEQYAVAMALMARVIGLPARVVVGFVIPEQPGGGPVEVTGDMAQAWVEIPFEDVGWMTFSPTPDRNKLPQQLAPKPKTSPQPKNIQPPPPPQQTVDLVSASSPGGGDEDFNPWAWLWAFLLDLLVLLGRALLLALLFFLVPVAVVVAKTRRTRSRRSEGDPRARVVGGWDDLVDTFVDLGAARREGATRREVAERVAEAHPALAVRPLAGGADAGAFAPGVLEEEQAEGYWAEIDRVRAELREATPAPVWWRARISPRSFLSEDRARGARLWGRDTARAVMQRVRGLRRGRDREWTR